MRIIRRQRQQIIRERPHEQRAGGIVDEFLGEDAAKALHGSTHDLTMQGQRVDDTTDVVDDGVIMDLHMPRLGIDADMDATCPIGIGRLPVVELAFAGDSGARNFGEGDTAAIVRMRNAIAQCDCRRLKAKTLGSDGPESLEQILRSDQHGVATHHGRARTI